MENNVLWYVLQGVVGASLALFSAVARRRMRRVDDRMTAIEAAMEQNKAKELDHLRTEQRLLAQRLDQLVVELSKRP
jgi:hypothetical protein